MPTRQSAPKKSTVKKEDAKVAARRATPKESTPPPAPTAPQRAAKQPALKEALSQIVIDFPTTDETIIPGHYAVRIGAPIGAQVELSVNGGRWESCRESVGFYWFDWWPEPGEQTLVARMRNEKGRWIASEPCVCSVIGADRN